MLILPNMAETSVIADMVVRMRAVMATLSWWHVSNLRQTFRYDEKPEEGWFFHPKYNTQIYFNSTLYIRFLL